MNADRIFGAFHALSELTQKRERLRELHAAAKPTCGGCFNWMKSGSCPREKNVNGLNRGPSCSGTPCEKFEATSYHLAAVEAYRAAVNGDAGI
jgi:hypothetical protein